MISNRMKAARIAAKLSKAEIARCLELPYSTYDGYEKGYREPNIETLQKLAAFFRVSIDYLVGQDNNDDGAKPASTGGVWIPVLGNVQAGVPVEAVEEVLDYEEITLDMAGIGDFFALRIHGDSMEPKISDGDVVIVKKQPDVESGDVAVVLVGSDDATIKRIKKRPEGIMLIPSNPSYEPMFYSNADVRKLPVAIIGKVVELRAKF